MVVSACTAAPTARPGVPIDGVNVVCDASQAWPSAPTCAAAIAAAVPTAGYAASQIDYAEYHYGDACPPGAPCASAPPNVGYVLIHLKSSGPVQVALSADSSGKVTVVGVLP
jgi:hypothetical protein